MLPGEVLHLLQDGVITELRAQKHHALLVTSEQRINNSDGPTKRLYHCFHDRGNQPEQMYNSSHGEGMSNGPRVGHSLGRTSRGVHPQAS